MKLDIQIDTDKFKKHLIDASKDAIKELQRALVDVSYKIEGDAKEAIQTGTRSGREYKRGNKIHIASAAGEFPKTDTGALVSNITTELHFAQLEATVGSRSSAPHGYKLEFGTSKIAPRPWLQPTFNKNKQYIDAKFNNALKNSLKKFGKKS